MTRVENDSVAPWKTKELLAWEYEIFFSLVALFMRCRSYSNARYTVCYSDSLAASKQHAT